ncbi:hypothetical protein [Burkholderia cenocepacia]|uniref:hypothetical protein n=1 Tax=Burkholderia cenocepacia TaxID=95486 RepID=UPI002AB6D825|nr:hypothetical protein [Burkholderia cenocepacia]
MSDPILSREQILKIVRKTLKENNDRDKLSSESFVKLYAALEAAVLEKVCGEPYAYEVTYDDESQQLVYAGYLMKYAAEEERSAPHTPLYALTRSKP